MLFCAHTLNLIAASDISKISDNNYNKISKSTFSKLSIFWNLASRNTAASDHKPLSLTIINNLEKRFNFLFYLNDPKSKDFIIASISHPKFKLDWGLFDTKIYAIKYLLKNVVLCPL
ncbi:Uncharacterized protein FWK35_00035698 [Aphis craccivora]|uniref:Uncharacterized protein n=1 Tax=Aphis craccivora TaxID=307492 RepID=A0A6G0VS51_APHCR|nr:Uncharacterized protein FWK35_00035698 [Aphis craccivora]